MYEKPQKKKQTYTTKYLYFNTDSGVKFLGQYKSKFKSKNYQMSDGGEITLSKDIIITDTLIHDIRAEAENE